MKNIAGNLEKMRVVYNNPVQYYLRVANNELLLNDFLGKQINLEFIGKINCIACNREIKKNFRGFCYPCSQNLAACDMCILKPETCHYHLGTCREPDWGMQHCFQDHIVYLSNSSGLKVGISRKINLPTRWIDQGAIQAIPLYQVANRYISGIVEVTLAQYFADKTNWRKMLKGDVELLDLYNIREQVIADHHELVCENLHNNNQEISNINFINDKAIDIEYPAIENINKISSFNFDKTLKVSDTLIGIKGQYLIFKTGVLNIRKFAGYNIAFNVV